MTLDVHPQDGGGLGGGVSRTVSDLHSAGLAPAAGLDLRFDDDAPTEIGGDGARLVGGRGDLAGRHGDAVIGEQLLRLIFEEIHSPSSRIRDRWSGSKVEGSRRGEPSQAY